VISFTDPVWLAEVRAWIGSQVTIAGEIEQPHVRPWSTVLRVPTTEGVAWFKAPREAFALGVVDGRAPDLEQLCDVLPSMTAEALRRRLPEAKAAFDRLARSPLAATTITATFTTGTCLPAMGMGASSTGATRRLRTRSCRSRWRRIRARGTPISTRG
jgi:hypothetical protein